MKSKIFGKHVSAFERLAEIKELIDTYCKERNEGTMDYERGYDLAARMLGPLDDLVAEVERLRGKLMLDSAGAFEAEAWVKDSDGWCVRAREGEDFTAHGWRRVRVREVAP